MSSIFPILSPSASTSVRPCHPWTSWTVAMSSSSWIARFPVRRRFPACRWHMSPGSTSNAEWRRDARGERVGSPAMAWHVVIAGGGFGGLYAARTLERVLPKQSTRVTLVNDVNFMLYTPLLPGAAAGTLEPRHVVVPLREELRETDLVLGQVRSADLDAGHVDIVTAAGAEER